MNSIKIKLFFIICIAIFLMLACQSNEQSSGASHSGALPHSSALPNKQLTKEEQRKLAKAKGKEVKKISVYDVEQMFDASEGRLHIFSFWKMNCTVCTETIQNLDTVLEEMDAEKYRLITINLDDATALSEVKTFIRSNNITAETYHLATPNDEIWYDGIHEDWNGEIPVTFFVKEDEELRAYLQKELEVNELTAYLNSLIF